MAVLSLLLALALALFHSTTASPSRLPNIGLTTLQTCQRIQRALSSSSLVLYPNDLDYTPQFAVKSGGHAPDAGFSSTKRIHISLSRFDQIDIAADKSYADIGPGQKWFDVYSSLKTHGISVVGGRYPDVGVGGLVVAGGGWSWHTQQPSLAIDTVQSMDVILLTGTFRTINPGDDLFFALSGGGNQFGIVTSLRMTAYPQTLPSSTFTLRTMIHGRSSFYTSISEVALMQALLFYDGPTPRAGIFDRFTVVPTLVVPGVINELKGQPFPDFVVAVSGGEGRKALSGFRRGFTTQLRYNITLAFLNAIKNEVLRLLVLLPLHSGVSIVIAIEPFISTTLAHSRPGAYPRSPNEPVPLPLNIDFLALPTRKAFWRNELKQIELNLRAALVAEGEEIPPVHYPNYARADTPIEQLFGENVDRLRAIRAQVDPLRVMDLAGGFEV